MARYNNGIYIPNNLDPVPTDAQGGYAGGDSTAAQVLQAGAAANAAVSTMENLKVAVTPLPHTSAPTAYMTGSVPTRIIALGVPQGRPGEPGRDGMGYEQGVQLVADSAAMKTATETAATRAENAEAAKLEIPDANTAAMIGNPATQTRTALKAAIGQDDNVVSRLKIDEAPLSPARFGTVGVGGDDTAVLTAAANAAAAASGGQLYLNGDYRVSKLVVPNKVAIFGDGKRSARITGTATGPALEVGSETVLSDLYLTCSRIAGSVGVFTRAESVHTTMRNMSVTGFDVGLDYKSSYVLEQRDSSIQACGIGIRVNTCNAIMVSGGEVQGCETGVYVVSGTQNYGLKFRTTVEGNSGMGFQLEGTTFGLVIRDSYLESNAGGHVMFTGGSHFATVIDGTSFLNRAPYGVQFATSGQVREVTVSHNYFNPTTIGARSLTATATVIGMYVEDNRENVPAAAFDPAIDFAGSRLTWRSNGKLVLPASANTASQGGSSLRIPHGVAPANPADGDMWTTTAGLFVRINGATVGPLS